MSDPILILAVALLMLNAFVSGVVVGRYWPERAKRIARMLHRVRK